MSSIVWTDSEREKVYTKISEILAEENLDFSKISFSTVAFAKVFVKAQEGIVTPDRYRSSPSRLESTKTLKAFFLSQVRDTNTWPHPSIVEPSKPLPEDNGIAQQLFQLGKAFETKISEQQSIISNLLERYSAIENRLVAIEHTTKDAQGLIDDLIDASLTKNEHDSILKLVELSITVAKVSPQKVQNVNRPKVVIIGLFDSWQAVLQKEYGNVLDLRMYTAEEANYVDGQYTFFMTAFANHSNYHVAKNNSGFTHVSGGLSSLKRELNKLV
jgi:hypothetical protein